MHRNVLVAAATCIAVAIAVWWFARPAALPAAASPEKPIPVQVGLAEVRDVPETYSTSGFVVPLNVVEVRPQITSTVRKIDIKEGQSVSVGQRMFTLDDRNDVANVDKSAAQTARDRALLEDARRTLTRNTDLKARGFVSQSAVDTAQSAVDALAATVASDQAVVTGAKVAVGYSALTASLSGRIGEIKVRVGSLVQANSAQPMTTITQLDPIDVAFSVPEKDAQKILSAQRDGEVPVRVLVDGKTLEGRLVFVDSGVDSASGGLKVKAEFRNPAGLLWSGTMVTAELALRTFSKAIVISPRAVQVGPKGQFVYRIEADSRVASMPVSVEYMSGDFAVVKGLTAGDKVVVEGGQNLRPGVKVTTNQGSTTQ